MAPRVPVPAALALAGVVVLAISAPDRDLPGALPEILLLPCFALLIAAAAGADLRRAPGLLTHRVLVHAGELSFAFYLVHGQVLSLVGRQVTPFPTKPVGALYVVGRVRDRGGRRRDPPPPGRETRPAPDRARRAHGSRCRRCDDTAGDVTRVCSRGAPSSTWRLFRGSDRVRVHLVSPVFHGYWQAVAASLEALGHDVSVVTYDHNAHLGDRAWHHLRHELPRRARVGRHRGLAREQTERAIESVRAADRTPWSW